MHWQQPLVNPVVLAELSVLAPAQELLPRIDLYLDLGPQVAWRIYGLWNYNFMLMVHAAVPYRDQRIIIVVAAFLRRSQNFSAWPISLRAGASCRRMPIDWWQNGKSVARPLTEALVETAAVRGFQGGTSLSQGGKMCSSGGSRGGRHECQHHLRHIGT